MPKVQMGLPGYHGALWVDCVNTDAPTEAAIRMMLLRDRPPAVPMRVLDDQGQVVSLNMPAKLLQLQRQERQAVATPAKPSALDRAELLIRRIEEAAGNLAEPTPPLTRWGAAIRALGVQQDAAERARRIAGLSDQAKAAARANGSAFNATILLQAARHAEPADQVAVIQGAAGRRMVRH